MGAGDRSVLIMRCRWLEILNREVRCAFSRCLRYVNSFISGMHHYECVAPNVDIILQSGWFWAMSIAAFRERFNDSRSCWVVFIHIVRGRPGGLLQFSKEQAVKICLASDLSDIRTMWPNRERRRAWTVAERCGCSVFRLTSLVEFMFRLEKKFRIFLIHIS